MKKSLFALAFVLLTATSVQAAEEQQTPAVSLEFLSGTARWVKNFNKVVGPVQKLQTLEASALSALSGSNEHLALAPVIREVRMQRKALAAKAGELSADERAAEIERLNHNQLVIHEFRNALVNIRKDLKPAVGLPLPRITTAPNLIESWYLFEIPALQRELSGLELAISAKKKILAPKTAKAAPEEKIPFFLADEAIEKVVDRMQQLKTEKPGTPEERLQRSASLEKELSDLEMELKDQAELLNFVHASANNITDEQVRSDLRTFEKNLRAYISKQAELRMLIVATKTKMLPQKVETESQSEPTLPPVVIPPKSAGVQQLEDVAAYVMQTRNAQAQTKAIVVREYNSGIRELYEQDRRSWEQAEAYAREFRRKHEGHVHVLQDVLAENHATLKDILQAAESRANYSSEAARKASREKLNAGREAFLSYAQREEQIWTKATASAIAQAEKQGWVPGFAETETPKVKDGKQADAAGDSQAQPAASEPASSGSLPDDAPKAKASRSNVDIFMELVTPKPRDSQPPGSEKPNVVVPIFNHRF